ncbi:MAG: hypothetical protein NVS4B7_03490 [Ktedonobacteraceae bacterium]
MMQTSSPNCPQCGTPMAPGQRFCSNCGATRDVGFSNPTAMSGSGEHHPQATEMAATGLSLPPPPPSELYSQTPTPPPPGNTYYPPQGPQNFPQAQQSFQQPAQGYQPTPAYAQPPKKDATKGVLAQMGCGVLLLILLIVGACAGVSYVGYRWLASAASTSTGTGSTTYNGGASTPKAIPTVTTQINQTITYASIETTILSTQEASNFSDDTNASSPVLMRVNVKEHNPTTSAVYLPYSDNYQLILPDGTAVVPANEQDSGSINQDVTRTNWIDFPLPSSIDSTKLTLRFGGTNEAQMNVSLTGKADLSKYQPKTISPNAAFQYAGLNWTLTTVTSSWSADGKQADSGMRYIVVTLKVDNPTADSYYVFANDYVRLQAGSITNPPTNSTFDSSIAAGETGKTGTITFLMPQNNSSFTMMLLARTDTTPPATQVTKDFQI